MALLDRAKSTTGNGAAPAANGGAPAATPAPLTEYTVKLRKPITTHGGQITTIKLTKPTAGAMIRLKTFPFTVFVAPDGSKSFKVHFDQIVEWIGEMGKVEAEHLDQMEHDDFAECTNAIVALLMGEQVSVGN
jgi:hypothetical protein